MPRAKSFLLPLCGAALFLAGCVSSPYPGVHTESLSKVAQPGEGYVMMSFAFAGVPPVGGDTNVIPRFDGYVFKIRNVDDPYSLYEIGLRANISSGYYRDFDGDTREGQSCTLAGQPGDVASLGTHALTSLVLVNEFVQPR